ncbi:MAG: hypothetical protein AAF383_29695 [Cyanobacteria bacterium P01_A01_bin.83]
MSYAIYLFHPKVKKRSLQNKFSLDEFRHPKLTDEQISYFKKRLEAYEYQELNIKDKVAEYEKYYEQCPVTVSIYETEIVFSVPYWKNSEEAIFEASMTVFEINDTQMFAIYNPQNGIWNEE